ncbi:hypothetical protein LSO4A_170010 [Candidatus Liberibacter solanacearum]
MSGKRQDNNAPRAIIPHSLSARAGEKLTFLARITLANAKIQCPLKVITAHSHCFLRTIMSNQ